MLNEPRGSSGVKDWVKKLIESTRLQCDQILNENKTNKKTDWVYMTAVFKTEAKRKNEFVCEKPPGWTFFTPIPGRRNCADFHFFPLSIRINVFVIRSSFIIPIIALISWPLATEEPSPHRFEWLREWPFFVVWLRENERNARLRD